ncbi:MAG: acyl carrier protein [Chloroflexi bacterium]|nr:acyl carrier protein [Chloroflexota bacterium]
MKIEIKKILSSYITSKILKQPARVLSGEQALLSSGMIDSMSLVDLAIFIEDTFHVRLDDAELNKETFDTLGELVSIIEERSI